MLVLDVIWIKYYMGSRYTSILSRILKVDNSINYFSAVIAYLIMIFSIYYFILRNTDTKITNHEYIKKAAILGFCIYGVYDATLYAVFPIKDYKTAIIDILWGTFLYGISTAAAIEYS